MEDLKWPVDMDGDLLDRLRGLLSTRAPSVMPATARDLTSLLDRGVRSLGDLSALVSSPDAGASEEAIWVLGELDEERAVPVLLQALRRQEPEVRRAAALALGRLGARDAVPALADVLKEDPEGTVRSQAAHSLGEIGRPDAASALRGTLDRRDEDPVVRGHAAEALAQLGDVRSVPALLAGLRDPSTDVRFWSAFALGELGDQSAVPDLEAVAASDEGELEGWGRVRDEASEAISMINRRHGNGSHAGP